MRRLLLATFLSLAAFAAACSQQQNRAPQGPVAKQPNVLFVMADDLGYGELGSFGQQKIRTPRLDQLAKEGMRLTRHYCGSPVCAPSPAARKRAHSRSCASTCSSAPRRSPLPGPAFGKTNVSSILD